MQVINNSELNIYTNKGYIYHVIINDDYYDISLYLNDHLLLNFIDTILDKNNISHFKRTLNDKTFIFKDGKEIYFSKSYSPKFLTPIKKKA